MRTLVVGCPTTGEITINYPTISHSEQMKMPGMGYSTENFYSFSLPTTPQSYCYVYKTEIISLRVDSVSAPSSGAVFFHDEASCTPLCDSIDIDPCYVENEVDFKIKYTFTNSNDLLSPETSLITFNKADCGDIDCLAEVYQFEEPSNI